MANRVITTILLGRDHMSDAFRSAARAADRHSASIGRAGESMASMSAATIKTTGKIAASSTALVQGATAALAVGQAAGVAAGALLVLPGALAAVKVGTLTLKLGLDGVNDAIKASATGGAAYKEALDKLAPSQQKFVKGVASQSKAFGDLKKNVGQKLFAGIGNDIGPLGERYLPIANRELSRLSGYFGQAASKLGDFAKKGSTVSKVTAILHSSADAGKGLANAVTPIASALLNIVSASSRSLPSLAGGLAGAAQRFDDFIARVTDNGKGGQFTTWIRNGIAQIGSLGGTIRALVAEVSKPAFRDGFTTVFAGLQASSAAVSREIPGLVAAVLKLVPAFASVAAASGASFGATLHVITGIVRTLAPAINAFAAALVPLAPLIGTIAPAAFLFGKALALWSAIKPIVIATRAWIIAQGGLNAVLMANPIGAVITAVALLAAGLVIAYKRSETFRAIANAAFRAVGNAVLIVVDRILWGFQKMAQAAGHLPGPLGKPFRDAAVSIGKARDQVNRLRADMNRIKSRTVNIKVVTTQIQKTLRDKGYLDYRKGERRAAGGPVKKGQPYIVGDGGRPELMVPDQNGTIMPKVPGSTGGGAWSGGGNTYVTVNVSGFVGNDTQLAAQVVRAFKASPAGSQKIPASAVAAR